jgi:hypothetical protein
MTAVATLSVARSHARALETTEKAKHFFIKKPSARRKHRSFISDIVVSDEVSWKLVQSLVAYLLLLLSIVCRWKAAAAKGHWQAVMATM